MKTKLIGILVCMLLITTALVSATNIEKEIIQPATYIVDVPIWEIGDTWIYNEHYAEFAYRTDGTRFFAWYHNCTSTYTVIDDTGDSYVVELTSDNNEGSMLIGNYRLKYTPFTKLTQELTHRKTDLAYTNWIHQEKGFVFWLLGNIGFPLPAYFSLRTEAAFTPAYELIPFPLSAGLTGTFPSFTSSGHQTSSLYFGLIKISDTDFTNTAAARSYVCEMTNITVPAGTYEAFNISFDNHRGRSQNFSYTYYAPEVGFSVKFYSHNNWGNTEKPSLDYNHELVSTTFTP